MSEYSIHLDFHVLHTLKKHGFFSHFTDIIPPYICHPYTKYTKQPSDYQIVDLSDNNENSSDGMIKIMTELHKLFVPKDACKHPNILEHVNFCGDVLTNERSTSAQSAMANGISDYEKLKGFIPRPGGLHLLMNFTMVLLYSMLHILACTQD